MAIRNHHVRPRRSRQPAPAPANLPKVVERPDLYDGVAFAQSVGEQHDHENLAVWHLVYRCEYEGDRVDEMADVRQVIAATRARAVKTLQELMAGFAVQRIILYHARGPMTMDQIAEIRRMNEQLEQMKKDTDSHG